MEKIYYDPFEKEIEVIRSKLKKVEAKNAKKQIEMDLLIKKVNFLRSAHKSVSHDQQSLRNQREALETENAKLSQQIDRKNDVKELHIMIDLLKNTDQGQDILKKKLVTLLGKVEFERTLYHELSNHYYKLEGRLNEAKGVAGDL